MNQDEKFPFQVIEGGKEKELKELRNSVIGYLLAYQQYIIKYKGENDAIDGYISEYETVLNLLKVEFSRKGTAVAEIEPNFEELESEQKARMPMVITPHRFYRKVKYDDSYGKIRDLLEKFMNIQKYLNDEILQVEFVED